MQHQCVALDLPTKSETPTSAVENTLAVQCLGMAGRAVYEGIKGCSDPNQLEEMGRQLWKHYGAGSVGDGEATYLSNIIESRRPLGRRMAPGHAKPIGKITGRLYSRFTSRQRHRSPVRKASRDRRRMLGGSSALPDNLRHHYTEGQRSVLCIVAGEVKRHGVCDLPIDMIAALAGVCRTTVQTAMHEARLRGVIKITERPQRGLKSLPNVVEIISSEWRAWVRRSPSAASRIGSNSLKLVSTTKNADLRKKGATDKKEQRRYYGGGRINPLADRNAGPPPVEHQERASMVGERTGNWHCCGVAEENIDRDFTARSSWSQPWLSASAEDR